MWHRFRAVSVLVFVLGLSSFIMLLRSRAVLGVMLRLHRSKPAPLASTTALTRQVASSFGGPQQNMSACLDGKWVAHDAQQGLVELLKQRKLKHVIEVGCYIGYAVVQLSMLLGEEGHWYQVLDRNTPQLYVDHIQHSLRIAGLQTKVILLVGSMVHVWNASLLPPYDLVLLSHWEDEQDALAFLEDHKALRSGTLVVADTVDPAFEQFAENYLTQVRDEERYSLTEVAVQGAEVYRRL
eukprot:GGOE01056076.1.p1 GENE.GGOE01056076.1~~GGOE01056076.1.p1  ORF type:complete len:239 (+),score=68.37 GGOE01056076.1:129-845(+)